MSLTTRLLPVAVACGLLLALAPRASAQFKDKNLDVRLHAAILLGKQDANHKVVVSILLDTMEDKNASRRRLAAEARQNLAHALDAGA